MSGDVSKLPKWAQRKIELLEMRLAEAEKQAEENLALAGLQDGRYGDLVVPRGKRIYFGERDVEGVTVLYDRGVLQVMSGGRGLSVRPRASNVVNIVREGQ